LCSERDRPRKGSHMQEEATIDTKNEITNPKTDIQVKVVGPDANSVEPITTPIAGRSTQGNRNLALVLLAAALIVMFGTGGYWLVYHATTGYTGGDAAACVAVLLF